MLARICKELTTQSMKICNNRLITQIENCTCLYSTSRGQEIRDLDIREVKARLAQIMGIQKGYNPKGPSRDHLLNLTPTNQKDLPPRSMQDSFQSVIIPLESDRILQEQYVTHLGRLRLGRFMEDMDMFAVWVAQKHILVPNLPPNSPLPYTLVTVLVDRIEFTDYVPTPENNVRLSGHVSLVGRSTMEVVVWLEQRTNAGWTKITRALFLMAARNANNTAAAPVNIISPLNAEEEKILSGGEERKSNRTRVQQFSLYNVIPSAEEQIIIHKSFTQTVTKNSLHTRVLPEGGFWLHDTRLSTLVMTHPQDRNLHNKVFGGFLMRHALELSWHCVLIFAKQPGRLLYISDIQFNHPVAVTSVLKMHSYVVFSEHNMVQVVVVAEILDERNARKTTSNMFHYTYELPTTAPTVFPNSYQDCIMFLDGRRHFYDCVHQYSVGGRNTR